MKRVSKVLAIPIIVDDSDGNVLFYGKLKDCANEDSANGIVTLTVPEAHVFPEGSYTIKLFCEEINGANETDFSNPWK